MGPRNLRGLKFLFGNSNAALPTGRSHGRFHASYYFFFQKYSPKELLCSWQDWSTQGEKCTKEKSVDALPADALADILLHKVCFRSLRKGLIVIIYSDSGGWNAKRIYAHRIMEIFFS